MRVAPIRRRKTPIAGRYKGRTSAPAAIRRLPLKAAPHGRVIASRARSGAPTRGRIHAAARFERRTSSLTRQPSPKRVLQAPHGATSSTARLEAQRHANMVTEGGERFNWNSGPDPLHCKKRCSSRSSMLHRTSRFERRATARAWPHVVTFRPTPSCQRPSSRGRPGTRIEVGAAAPPGHASAFFGSLASRLTAEKSARFEATLSAEETGAEVLPASPESPSWSAPEANRDSPRAARI